MSENPLHAAGPEDLESQTRSLRRLAVALVGDAAADDVVQDAFGAALTARRPIVDLRGFLRGAVRKRSQESRRAEHRRRTREAVHGEGREWSVEGADASAARIDAMQEVLTELRDLPNAQRQAISMRFLDDLDVNEIASRAGVEAATVRGHLSRGLAAIRERLDRRHGDRSTWTAALLPLAASTRTLTRAAAPSLPAAAGAAIATATAAMSIKTISLAAVPVIAAAFWITTNLDPGDSVTRTTERETERDSQVAGLETVDVPETVERSEAEGPAAPNTTKRSIEAPSATVVTVVDEITGEAIPDLYVRFETGPVHGDTPASLDGPHSTAGERTDEITTDSDGAFELPASNESGVVRVFDDHGRRWSSPELTELQVDRGSGATVETRVGPTFHLVGSPGVPWSDMRAEFIDENGKSDVDHWTRVRESADGGAWVRYPEPVTRLTGDGPWRIRIADTEGRSVGYAEVDRIVGIEETPLRIDFEEYGAIRFRVDVAPSALLPIGMIELVRLEDGSEHTTFLDPAITKPGETRSALATARSLVPGRYRWSFQGASDEVLVEATRLTRVTLPPHEGETFDVVIPIDATGVPEVQLQNALLRVLRPNEMYIGYSQVATPAASGAEDQWELVLKGLPGGEWLVSTPINDTFLEWTPERVKVDTAAAPPVIVVREKSTPKPLRLVVVDAMTREPIPGAEAGIDVGGGAYRILRAEPDGALPTCDVPSSGTTEAFVRAPGYRLVRVDIDLDELGESLENPLELGWRSCVRVVEAGFFGPLEGIEVLENGRAVGRTDENGIAWLTGDELPTSLEVALDGTGYEELRRMPLANENGPLDPLLGFSFTLRKR